MNHSHSDKDGAALGMGAPMTRRDFVNAALVASGATLVAPGCAPANPGAPAHDPWTGFAGVGDYARSNGNTAEVVEAAHRIRDAGWLEALPRLVAEEPSETYDLIVVGGGFSGLSAARAFRKARPDAKILILDNHPVFGGEAKENEFDVDGHRLLGPQGSNDTGAPAEGAGLPGELWSEIGLPREFDWAPPENFDANAVRVARDNFTPMWWDESRASIGWWLKNDLTGPEGRWVVDMLAGGLDDAPISEELRRDLKRLTTENPPPFDGEPAARGRWLDSISYGDFLTDVWGVGPEAKAFADAIIAGAQSGAGCDLVSAFSAASISCPGTVTWPNPYAEAEIFSFPGGNATILRHLAKSLIPGAIRGDATFGAVGAGRIDFAALDVPENGVRLRLSSTAVDVRREGDGAVRVTYARGGGLESVRGSAAVLAIGSWVSRRIFADPSDDVRASLGQFHHGPMLVVNVALRNWRFLERLGVSAAHWLDGFGFFANIRQPMHVGDIRPPFDPDKPAVMTYYAPFLFPGLSLGEHGAAGRNELLSTSYADFELTIRRQMQEMYGAAGFDAKRDIAGVILNRWGHAYVTPQPGFYFGREGAPAPRDALRAGDGRILFGHSELAGHQAWVTAVIEGARAGEQAAAVA